MPLRHCPPLIYKYCDPKPQRIEGLTQGLIRYTPLSAFNDPFEGRPNITSLAPIAELERIIDAKTPEIIESLYEQIPPERRSAIPFDTFSRLCHVQMYENRKDILQDTQASLPIATNVLTKLLDEKLGACSFSEVPDSLLMWAHYGLWHTGFVIEFNAHHPYFHDRRSEVDEFRHLRRVLYRSARPGGHLTGFSGADIFLVKSEHWAYEREWRIIQAIEDASKTITTAEGQIHLFSFPLEAVTSIVFGARMTPETEKQLRSFANSQQNKIVLKRVVPDNSDFILRIREEIA